MNAAQRLLAALFALALVAGACGSDEPNDGGGTTAAPQSTDSGGTTAAPDGTASGSTTAAPDGTEGGGAGDDLTIGLVLVGPENDRGWSQAHREGIAYVEEQTGANVIVIDKMNGTDRPETTVEQVVDDMVDEGADIVFLTSDDMKDGALASAANHPDVPIVWASGDSAWTDGEGYQADLTNLANVMGQMEFGKMMAGCAAAINSETGSIGYVGALINDETRRLVNSAYLGARHCWAEKGNDVADLSFEVNWIGFWFNIPGVTLDPTQVANEFFDSGADVLISGIDTTEALVRAGQRADAGENVFAVPYDYVDACAEAPSICLGTPYFNWGPSYLALVDSVSAGSFAATWTWAEPDWSDLNNLDTTAIGFVQGDGLADSTILDALIAGLSDGSINLYSGPLNFQDGSSFLADGETATDGQIWYTEKLLEGIEGADSE